jgi:ligand-binding sensor domain-containing protein
MFMKRTFWLIGFLQMFISLSLIGQEYLYSVQFKKIDPSKFGNFVRSMVLDRNGLLWLATTNGVVRFNGFVFDQFTRGKSPISVKSNEVFYMLRDADLLYFATDNGLQVFHTGTYTEQKIPGYVEDGVKVEMILRDGRTGLWWFSADGYVNNLRFGKLHRVKIGSLALQDMQHDGTHLWLAFPGKCAVVDFDSYQTKFIPLPNPDQRYVGFTRGDLEELSLINGRHTYALKQGNLNDRPNSQISEHVSQLVVNGAGERFIVLNRNQLVHEYPVKGGVKKVQIPLSIDVPYSIHYLTLMGDYLLVGTSAGFVIVRYSPNYFIPFRSTLIADIGQYDDPRGIAEDSTHYYLAGYQSIAAYHKRTRRSSLLNGSGLLTHGMLRVGGDLWLATEGQGLCRLNIRTKRVDRFTKDTLYEHNFLISIAKWGNAFIIGGYRILMTYDPSTDRFQYPVTRYAGIDVSSTMIKKIEPLGKDRCLLGTDKGVFLINSRFEVIRHYRTDESLEPNNSDRVNDFLIAPDSSLWVATHEGLLQYSPFGRLLKKFTRTEGLAGNIVATLCWDRDGSIWAGTYDGLSRIDPRKYEIINFFREDGLPDNEFNHSSVLQSSSGEIVMGTVSGFIRFDPESLKRPLRGLDSIRISHIEYGTDKGDTIIYNPAFGKDKIIRIKKGIHYAKLYFFSNPLITSENSMYQYRIDGIHQNWVNMGSSPILHLDNAKTGKYDLKVRIISGNGSIDIMEQTYPVEVEQYFYRTPLFYGLIIGTLLGVIMLYIRSIRGRERKLLELRMELAQDLHDEIGGYLTGITMNMDLMQKNAANFSQYQRTIRSLGRKAVFALKDGLWSLDNQSDNAQQLWDRVKSITKENLEPLDIGFRFSQTGEINDIQLTILEKRNLLYIAKECLTNCIKYGDGGIVSLDWLKEDGAHAIRISNHVGKKRQEENQSGHGLHNMQVRMARIGGEMTSEEKDGVFTTTLKLLFIHDKIRHYRR